MSLAGITTPMTASAHSTQPLVQACLLGWAGVEMLLWLRNRGGNTAPDLTFGLVVASVAAGVNLAFRAAHDPATATGGGLAVTAAGLAAFILGVALRTWAILALGHLFKFVVVIQEDHRVVSSGPYRLVRHPSYSGGLLALAGAGIALHNWISIVAAAGVPLLAILIRIAVEEARLTRDLGEDYRRYARCTKRLIPGVW
ncbi:MAG TPA: isoprenylcysteine carboxylmethyltransferase family protein [Streptosporangiaceae bacterium]|jgi:protein-S-isoprenylcysteine O-methyltransferase Ste14|nr:isoprenylcysteine carboxylmethyltransferase family protein [Streptosporangiaceae bacterium]